MTSSPEHLSLAGRHLLDRRRFLSSCATALGSIAFSSLLADEGVLIDPARPYAPRRPHFPAKAKNVVVIFCAGAVSQLETWDYKPELIKWDNKPLPGGPAVTFQGPAGNLAQQQAAAVAGEVTAGKISLHTAAAQPLKLKSLLITLCRRLSRVHGGR